MRWLTEEADATLLRLVVNVLTPCLIFDKVLGNQALQRAENLFIPPLMGFGGIVLGIGLCWLFRRRVGLKTDSEQRTFALVAGLQNYGYVPFPLVLVLFANHPDTPGVLFVHNLGVDIAMWTLGLMTLGHATGPGEWRKLINAPSWPSSSPSFSTPAARRAGCLARWASRPPCWVPVPFRWASC